MKNKTALMALAVEMAIMLTAIAVMSRAAEPIELGISTHRFMAGSIQVANYGPTQGESFSSAYMGATNVTFATNYAGTITMDGTTFTTEQLRAGLEMVASLAANLAQAPVYVPPNEAPKLSIDALMEELFYTRKEYGEALMRLDRLERKTKPEMTLDREFVFLSYGNSGTPIITNEIPKGRYWFGVDQLVAVDMENRLYLNRNALLEILNKTQP